jgi:SAM-dependent methyltransferase
MDSIKRFSSRVEDYMSARPGYPKPIIEFLKDHCYLKTNSIVADIGSGTGLFTKLLLDEGLTVYGVEPNDVMRKAAENYLTGYPNFKSINGQAELTHLPDQSIDLITVAQAYHWFDQEKVHTEFLRILKPQRYIFLVWNLRHNDTNFMKDYEQLLIEFGTDYLQVSAENANEDNFQFGSQSFKTIQFDNMQVLNWDQLKKRLLSCSYIPTKEASTYPAMMEKLRAIYDEHQINGTVQFNYITKCCYLMPGEAVNC